MSVQYLDLGRAIFNLSKANLQLEIKASAVVLPGKDDGSSASSSQVLEQYSSFGDVWMCKSHNLHLSFLASFDRSTPHITGIERPCLNYLGHILESAEFWSQLALQPRLSLHSPNDLESTHFLLGLSDHHKQDVEQSPPTSAPKSSLDVSNLRAPRSILTAYLKSVQISLHFSQPSSYRSTSADPTKSDSLSDFEDQLEQEISTPGVPSSSQNHRKDQQVDAPKRGISSSAVSHSRLPSDKLPAETTHSNRTSYDVEDRPPASAGFVSIRKDVASGVKAKAVGKKNPPKPRDYTIPMIQLTDAGLRTIISPRPTRLAAGITISEESSLNHLVDIAPSVFAPGYREEVQARARLIPAIAKFLSQYLHQPRTAIQRERRDSLLREDLPSEVCGKVDELVHQVEELKETITGHLWMTLANGLRNLETPRRLKPLNTTQAKKIAHFEDLLNLEDPEHTPNHVQTGFESRLLDEDEDFEDSKDGFENLFLDEDDEFEDLEGDHFSDLYEEALSRPQIGINRPRSFASELFAIEGTHEHQGCNQIRLAWDPNEDMIGDVDAKQRPSSADRDGTLEDDSYVGECSNHKDIGTIHSLPYSDPCHLDYSALGYNQDVEHLDVIGGGFPNPYYVSRPHPNYHHLEDGVEDQMIVDGGSLQVFEDIDLHEFPDLEGILREGQDLIIDQDYRQSAKSPSTDLDLDMSTTYDRPNETSLSDTLGNEHMLWHMWTRRPSMTTSDREIHAMYASDPDMRLFDRQDTTSDENIDDYMLEAASSTNSSSRSTSTTSIAQDSLPYRPRPVDQQSIPSRPSKEHSASSPARDESRRISGKHLPGFLKRMSIARISVDETFELSRSSSSQELREADIKIRETLADYDDVPDGDEMLLS